MSDHILPSELSDGYHTISELYSHRNLLFINILNIHHVKSFKTRRDDRGEALEGWFIGGIDSDFGQISYHLPIRYWDLVFVKELERNAGYDGHGTEEVLDRLGKLAVYSSNYVVNLEERLAELEGGIK